MIDVLFTVLKNILIGMIAAPVVWFLVYMLILTTAKILIQF